MSGCMRKIHWGSILFAAVASAAVGLVIGYFWIRAMDLQACMASAVAPNSGNPVSDLVTRLVQILVVGAACIIVRMMLFVPLYIALAVILCTVIVLWRVRDAKLFNIILSVLLSLGLEIVALLVLSMLIKP